MLRRRPRKYDVAFYMPFAGALLATGSDAPTSGGAETQIYMLASQLASQGLKVAMIVVDQPGGLPKQVNGVDVIIRRPYAGRQSGSGNSWIIGAIVEILTVAGVAAKVPAKAVVQRVSSANTGLVALGCMLGR